MAEPVEPGVELAGDEATAVKTAPPVETPEVTPAAIVPEAAAEAKGSPAAAPEPLVKRAVGRPRKVPVEARAPAKAAPAIAPKAPAVAKAVTPVKSAPAKMVSEKKPTRKPAKPVPTRVIEAVTAPVVKTVAAVAAKAQAPAPKTPLARTIAPKIVAKTAMKTVAAPVARAAAASRKDFSIMTATTTEYTEKFQSVIKEASDKAKAAFEKSQASLGEMGAFTKGNVEAMVESSKILASGLQEMTKGYAAESKSAFETLAAEIKSMTSVKSPTELLEMQSSLLRKHFDAAVAASSKNSEAMLKLANEAFQPISNRVSLAVEKIKHAA
jgi:phasin family protein